MASQKCDQCGAPLPGGDVGSTVPCKYCGTHNVLRDPRHAARNGASGVLARSAAGPLVAVAAVVAIAVVSVTTLLSRKPGATTDDAQSKPESVSPANLKRLGEADHLNRIGNLDRAGLQGNLQAFDVTGNLPWVVKLARTWAIDAELAWVNVNGILIDGRVDVGPKGTASVEYVLSSAGRDAAARELAKVSTRLSFMTIQISFARGRVDAQVITGYHDSIGAEVTFGCGFEPMLAAWRKKGLPVRDSYNVRLERRFRPNAQGPAADWRSQDWGLPVVDPGSCQFL